MVDLCAWCNKPLNSRIRKTFYSQSCDVLFSLDFCTEKCILAYEKNVSVGDRRPSNEELEKIAIKKARE